jgi:hypothetical protein
MVENVGNINQTNGILDDKCDAAWGNFEMRFDEMPTNCCRPTHIEPFRLDLHLFGFECQENILVFFGIILLTVGIKLFQNFLGTWIGQLERELMQMKANERWGSGKLQKLILWEIVGGIVGVISILVITGNNFWIWLTIVLANAGGVWWSFKATKPDHHSPAAELEALMQNTRLALEAPYGASAEEKRALKALQMLQCLMQEDLTMKTTKGVVVVCMDKPEVRQRLIL